MNERLKKLSTFNGRPGPVVLCIMDGIGVGPADEGNAVSRAYTPHLDWLRDHCPWRLLQAHGTAVGLPSDADMGNSEVGHNAIGCGRVFAQGAKLVNQAIEQRTLFEGKIWQEQIENVLANNSKLHFLGLFSDGNVHSHIDHLKAMIEEAARRGVAKVRVHILLDGRDVGETSALEYVLPFEDFLESFRRDGLDYRIASGGGRMYITMDRYEANWSMVERGWNTHVHGQGRPFRSAQEAIETYRQELGCIDQDMPEFVIVDDSGEPVGRIEDGDSVILYNFRGDRAIEISRAFEEGPEFDKFDRGRVPKVLYAGMMEYDGDLHIPKRFLVNPPAIDRTVGEFLVNEGITQLAVSETQKFGHVTYFYNGNRSGKFDDQLEEYVEIPSDIIPFEYKPWMKSTEITERILQALSTNSHRFIRLNYPNGDMVGHTGVMQAAIIGVESVDMNLGRIIQAVREANGVLIVSADHGNADEMIERDKKGNLVFNDGVPKAKTSHTLNPVPCYIFDPQFNGEYRINEEGKLGISSLAATVMNFLGYEAPEDYDPSVIKFC